MNRVSFIGAGPGDPELLTLRGARALERAGAVFALPPYEQTFSALLEGKRILVPFDFSFEELLERLEMLLDEGEVAFLIPGDQSFFSPFQALIDRLGKRAEVIPGVGTANAVSAYLKKTLDLPGVCNRTILASPRTLGDGEGAPRIADLAAPGVTLIIYMNTLPLAELTAQLKRGYGKNVPIVLAHRLCLPGQEVVCGTLDDIGAKVGERESELFNLGGQRSRPALTLVVVGETLSATTDGRWWNFRREHLWRDRNEG